MEKEKYVLANETEIRKILNTEYFDSAIRINSSSVLLKFDSPHWFVPFDIYVKQILSLPYLITMYEHPLSGIPPYFTKIINQGDEEQRITDDEAIVYMRSDWYAYRSGENQISGYWRLKNKDDA